MKYVLNWCMVVTTALLVITIVKPKWGGLFWYAVLSPHEAIPDFYNFLKYEYFVETKAWHRKAQKDWISMFEHKTKFNDSEKKQILRRIKKDHSGWTSYEEYSKRFKLAIKENQKRRKNDG